VFFLSRPSEDRVRELLRAHRDQRLSYAEVGATLGGSIPQRYAIDHNRVQLGSGEATWHRAQDALRRWCMFDLGWLELCYPDTPIEAGREVLVLVHHVGIWSANPCRIVRVIDENGVQERFGFAYGTLSAHAEIGEERFTVEWNHADDSVWYDILAFSRPGALLARLGYPFTRVLQKRFAQDSKQAMLRAMGH
jgi:uncharacterized protein (UPF0548 family)